MYRFILVIFCLILFSTVYGASLTENDMMRYNLLIKEIRCVVCQNQSLADSNALLAQDLRATIYAMVAEKKSDQEIKHYLVKRYGEFILLRPRFSKETAMLWILPIMGMFFILLLIYAL